jgi:hypothetical protein
VDHPSHTVVNPWAMVHQLRHIVAAYSYLQQC